MRNLAHICSHRNKILCFVCLGCMHLGNGGAEQPGAVPRLPGGVLELGGEDLPGEGKGKG